MKNGFWKVGIEGGVGLGGLCGWIEGFGIWGLESGYLIFKMWVN